MTSVFSGLQPMALTLRLAPLVLVPILLVASTFPGEFEVSRVYWALACTAAAVFACGARWPVSASLVLSALAVPMLAAEAWGLSGVVPYLGAFAVADVAARIDQDRVIAAVGVTWSAALAVGAFLDGQARGWTAADAVTIMAAVGLPLLFGLYLRGKRRLARDAELRRAAAETAVRSEERTAMARELHDIVAHHMASIVLRTSVAEHVISDPDPRVAEVLADVHGTATAALSDIRRLQAALRDPVLSEVAMIEPDAVWTEIDAAVERARAARFTIAADVDRSITGLDAITRLTLLRVTQEALTNVMKHADVSGPVELTVVQRDGGVAIRVSSACAGGMQANTQGHGVIGMAERLELIGGRFAASPDGGHWVIDAWLPKSVGNTHGVAR